MKRVNWGVVSLLVVALAVPFAFATPGTGITFEQMWQFFSGSGAYQANVKVQGISSAGGNAFNPVQVGALSTAQGSNPTQKNTTVMLSADKEGALFVRPGGPNAWTCNLTGLAASLTQCQALVASERLYITDIIVQTTTATAGTYQIKYGTGTNCATGTTSLMAFAATAPISTATTQYEHFTVPLVPAAGNAICVIGTATNTINIQLGGFVGP